MVMIPAETLTMLEHEARDRLTAAMESSNEQLAKLVALREAATKWPRCCDLWQDGLGGMHCTECAQKTFAMMREIQKILGVGKGCEQRSQ